MATVIIMVKIMPESLSTNLSDIKKETANFLISEGAKNISSEKKPIAFGLKALFITFTFPEEKGIEMVEQKLLEIKGVSSVTIEDYRRAFG